MIILALVGLCNCVPTPDTDYFDSVPQENLPADQPDNSDFENLSSDQADIENLSSDESDFYDETPQENVSDDSKDADLDREPSDFEIPAGSKLVKEDSLPLTNDESGGQLSGLTLGRTLTLAYASTTILDAAVSPQAAWISS